PGLAYRGAERANEPGRRQGGHLRLRAAERIEIDFENPQGVARTQRLERSAPAAAHQRDRAMPACEEILDDFAADEPGAAGDQNCLTRDHIGLLVRCAFAPM